MNFVPLKVNCSKTWKLKQKLLYWLGGWFYFLFIYSFVTRIFGHALEDSQSKSGLVHSLSVCISLLDPKRSVYSPLINSIRSQHLYGPPIPVNPETVSAMLPKLGKLMNIVVMGLLKWFMFTSYGLFFSADEIWSVFMTIVRMKFFYAYCVCDQYVRVIMKIIIHCWFQSSSITVNLH